MIKKYIKYLVLLNIVLALIGYTNIRKNNYKNIVWQSYGEYYYTISYPSNWSYIDNQYNVDFKNNRSLPFFDSNIKCSIKLIKENSSLEEFESIINKYDKESKGKGQLTKSNKKLMYTILNEDSKAIKHTTFFYKDSLILKIEFFIKNKYKNNANIIMNTMLKSFELSKKGYESFTTVLEKNWLRYTKGPLDIYYEKNSVVANDIENWTKERLEAFGYICGYLKTDWVYDEKIKIYIFDSMEEGFKYGLELGFSSIGNRKIFTLYNQSRGHELTHIISANMNKLASPSKLPWIPSLLILEGLATHLDMSRWDHHGIAKRVLEKNNYEIKLLGENFRNVKKKNKSYKLAASFVKYLIDSYGIDLFLKFYSQSEYSEEESFLKYYGKSGEKIIEEWESFLKKYN